MPPVRRPPRMTLAAALGVLALVAAGASGGGTALGDSSTVPCGASTAATVAIGRRVGRDQHLPGRAGRRRDVREREPRCELGGAARGRRGRTGAPRCTPRCIRLVYHPIWHIVRLRVLDAAGHVLADIGGPYVIAPVPGVLRPDGRAIGSFVMSVQDDVGFTKLETHAVGDPIGIYYRRAASSPQLGARLPDGAAEHGDADRRRRSPTASIKDDLQRVPGRDADRGDPCSCRRPRRWSRASPASP